MGCMDSTPEQEYDQNVELVQSMLDDTFGEKRCVVKPYRIHCFDAREIKPGTRMVLFDFGGMGLGNSLGDSNARDMVKHAMENPSILYLVVSGFTWSNVVKWQIEELGAEGIPNVLSYYDMPYKENGYEKEIPVWFDPGGGK